MLPQDVFRARLDQAIASISYWVPSIADVADVEQMDGDGYWRIRITPCVPNACAFELVLRGDQKFDLMIDGEVYEDRDIEVVEVFLPLVDAIASGNAEQHRWSSTATSTLRAIETRIMLPDGHIWRDGHPDEFFQRLTLAPPEGVELEVRRFLPYRR
jgi:hypothetical protein